MKVRALLLIASLALLTSCGESAPLITGEVVSCNHIPLIDTPPQKLEVGCLDGSPGVNIAAIKGPAIINVWGSWCDPCKEELPYFSEYFQSKAPEIQLIGIDVEETKIEEGRMFARTHGIMWPNLYDSNGATRSYFGNGVPVTWFIGSDGEVLFKKIGPIKSVEELRSLSFKYFDPSVKTTIKKKAQVAKSSTPKEGAVVSCSDVKFHTAPEKDLILNCLNGAQGFNVGAIQGPAIINVWGSWCPPCVNEIPIFVDFYATRDPAIQLVGVDFQDGPLFAVEPYIKKSGITWPNFADKDGLARGYFGNSVPVSWFIDSNSQVAYKKFGPVESISELRQLSKKYLGLS